MSNIFTQFLDELLKASLFKFKEKIRSVQVYVSIFNTEVKQNSKEETTKC
jgi:hypothetical protein